MEELIELLDEDGDYNLQIIKSEGNGFSELVIKATGNRFSFEISDINEIKASLQNLINKMHSVIYRLKHY